MERILKVLSDGSSAAQAVAAIATVLALVPNAILFFINQEAERRRRKEERHRHVLGEYHKFLEVCLQNAHLGLPDGQVIEEKSLTPERLLQRDILFEMQTSMFEQAYLSYKNSKEAFHLEQWGGWHDYIRCSVERKDFLQWWHRVMLEGNFNNIEKLNMTQYDKSFEFYMNSHLRAHKNFLASLG